MANTLACSSVPSVFFLSFVFSLSHFSFYHVTKGTLYLASHFMHLRSPFFGVDVGRHTQRSTGGIAKGRDRVGEIKVCHINFTLCESPRQHRERQTSSQTQENVIKMLAL